MTLDHPFRWDLHGAAVDDACFLPPLCRPLKILHLSSCTHVTDKGLKTLLQLGTIHSLSITSCPQITNATLEEIASHLKNLETLELSDMSHLSDYALSMVLASCPKLTNLSIDQCEGFGDQALFAISLFGKNIHSLRISANSGFTEQGFTYLPKNLQTLNISSSPQLSNGICQNLISTSRHLTYFDASFCSRLSCPIAEIGPHPSIRILNLRGCPLEDSSIEIAAKRCRSLTHLYLAYSSITDKSLQSLAANTPKLKVLDLSRCTKLTDDGVQKIVQFCPLLQQLNTLGCSLLSPKYHSFFRLKTKIVE
jgi:hypothetical protein